VRGEAFADRVLLLSARGLRAFGFGFSAVLLGVHLERAGLAPAQIGLTLGIGLAAASLTGLVAAALARPLGRRLTLALIGLLMALTGFDLALTTRPALLILSGVTGMLGAASVDYGPFAAVEQAVLTETASPGARNRAFGRYSLTGGLFNAAGGLSTALFAAGRAYFLLYAAIGLVTAALPLFMSAHVEGEPVPRAFGSFKPLAGLAALFALDSLGGGFVASAVIAYWLHVRFGAGPGLLGPIFAGVAIMQSLSYEVSGRLADRIGLVNTMVFTHLPSNVLLLLVPFSPSLPWAVALLLGRFALSQMDVPARQAYIVSIVPPGERAGAVAMTGAVRGVAMSFGPTLAGVAIGAAAFGFPFFAGGGLKIVYDLALYGGFRNRRAEHET
jgi:MFS family permease